MFVDAVWANVLVFAVGQVFAWLYLRSGRFWTGAAATTLLWVAIDWWLIARFVLSTPVAEQRLPLLLLQLTALATTIAWCWAKLRARRAAGQRGERHREAIALLLRGEAERAAACFAALTWIDPWDVSAWIGRGDALRRLGQVARAGRCYRRAAGVDGDKRFEDLLAHRVALLRSQPANIATGPAPDVTATRPDPRGRAAVGS